MNRKKVLLILSSLCAGLLVLFGVSPATAGTNVGGWEAEAMTSVQGYGTSVYSDANASGGKALKIDSNVTVKTTVTTTADADALWLKAKTDPNSGVAKMTVVVDGVTVATDAGVAVTSFGGYKFTGSWAAGTHTVKVSFTNSCCRNLYLDNGNFATSAVVTDPTPTPTPTDTATPTPTPTQTTPPASGETGTINKSAYITGYDYWDNTPAGSSTISNPVIHSKAAGTGTWADPVTLAVGHDLHTGQDVLDYPEGTRFYVPSLQKYLIVEDTCGDGAKPETIGCHKLFNTANGNDAPAGATTWIDVWVGGAGGTQAQSDACEENLTALHTIVVNPSVQNYKVTAGDISQGSGCKANFGETLQTQ